MLRIKVNIIPTIITIIVGIVSGVAANRVDAFFFSSNPQPKALFLANLVPWTLVGCALLYGFYISFFMGLERRNWNRLLTLNVSLLGYLPNIISDKDVLDGRFGRLVERLLTHTALQLHNVRRGVLFLPDDNKEYLKIRKHAGWQNDGNEDEEEFYIGKKKDLQDKKGIAGKVFHEKKSCVVKFTRKENGELKPSCDEYVFLPSNSGRKSLPYVSLVCVPILNSAEECLGVVCYDSKEPNAFDSDKVQQELSLLAQHMASALNIYAAMEHII